MLIYSRQLSDLAGIGHDRFEQRRLRERAADDVAQSLGDDDSVRMPIAPSGHGQRAGYDALDATLLRAVVQLEAAGVSFAAACRLLRAVSPAVMFPDAADIFAAAWLEPAGSVRRIVGTSVELRRAMPESPSVSYCINITSTRDDVTLRAHMLLGLRVVGCKFAEKASL